MCHQWSRISISQLALPQAMFIWALSEHSIWFATWTSLLTQSKTWHGITWVCTLHLNIRCRCTLSPGHSTSPFWLWTSKMKSRTPCSDVCGTGRSWRQSVSITESKCTWIKEASQICLFRDPASRCLSPAMGSSSITSLSTKASTVTFSQFWT